MKKTLKHTARLRLLALIIEKWQQSLKRVWEQVSKKNDKLKAITGLNTQVIANLEIDAQWKSKIVLRKILQWTTSMETATN